MFCSFPMWSYGRHFNGVPMKEPTFPNLWAGGLFRWKTWIAPIELEYCFLTDTVPWQSPSTTGLWFCFSLPLQVWLTMLLSIVLCNVGLSMVFGGLVVWWEGVRESSLSSKSIGGMPHVYISCIKKKIKLGVLREVFALCLRYGSMSIVNISWPEFCGTHSPETEAYTNVSISNWWTKEGASAKSEQALK